MGTVDRRGRRSSRRDRRHSAGFFVLGLVFGTLIGVGVAVWFFLPLRSLGAAANPLAGAMLLLVWVASIVLLHGLLGTVGRSLEVFSRVVEQGLAAMSRECGRLAATVEAGLARLEGARITSAEPGPPLLDRSIAEPSASTHRGPADLRKSAQDRGTATGSAVPDQEVQGAGLDPPVPLEEPASALPTGRLMEVWDDYRDHGDGYFRAVDFAQRLAGHGLPVGVWPGKQLQLGNGVLIVGNDLDGELVLVPSFTKAPRELAAWFDSEAGIRSPRIQLWHHPARVRYRGGRLEIIERGRVE